MSYHDYRVGQEIVVDDPSFAAIIQAAMRKAGGGRSIPGSPITTVAAARAGPGVGTPGSGAAVTNPST